MSSFQNANCLACSVCSSTVLLEDKQLARDLTHDMFASLQGFTWSCTTVASRLLSTCVICHSVPEADCDRPHTATSSSSQLQRILDDVVLPCLHHWHGTGCYQRSGTISRWNLSSLNSRLICSTALTSTIISIILGWHWYACSRKSRSCNGLVETCYDALEIVWATTTTATHSSCSVSSTSKQYVLLIFTPRSTNISFVLINLNMPTHTVNDLLKVRSRSIVG